MRKKLFAVIMSVMMMVTFMPAMAFAGLAAGTVVNWASDYSEVKVTLATGEWAVVKADRTFDTTTGVVKADLTQAYTSTDLEDYSCSADKMTALLADLNQVADKEFYDLKDAQIVYTSSSTQVVLGSTIPAADFATLIGGTGFYGLKLVQPAYTFTTGSAAKKVIQLSSFAGNNVDLSLPTATDLGYEESTADQEVTLPVYTSADGTGCVVINGPVSKTITVKGAEAKAANAKFYVDSVAAANEVTGSAALTKTVGYDGAEHKIVMNELKDVTITSIEKFNWKTGGYEKVDAMTYKDATTSARPNQWKVSVKDSKNNLVEKTIKVEVEAVTVTVGLKGYTVLGGTDKYVDAYAGEEINPINYVDYTVTSTNVKAGKAAVKAEKEAIATWLAKYYDLAVKTEGTDTIISIKVKEDAEGLDLTSAKYKYSDNFAITVTEEEATVNYDDVKNVVVASNQSKTYHVKKAGKLKSTKTFQLKGDVTDYGKVSYIKKSGNSKIKVASNGKVTVKKGLKKGTYTVKLVVKAAGAKDTKTLKVKIVK